MTQNEQSEQKTPHEYNEQEVYIRNGLRVATAAYHQKSAERGWWDVPVLTRLLKDGHITQVEYDNLMSYVYATKLMLVVSEIGEAMEGLRKDKMDDHLPARKSVEVELGDALIRIFDLAGKLKLDLGAATVEKGRYNTIRADHDLATRTAAGGKKF